MRTTGTVKSIKRHAGIAGQVSYTATVQYPGEDASTVTFVGSEAYGGPVVMVSENGAQAFVTDPERLGPFGESWVRSFFA